MILGDWLFNIFHIILTAGLVLYLYSLNEL
ncbi:MAG: hypothetical protein K0R78_1653 [Pelosinus sp.]|jgi:hypothetical protein|nr:hypothetical protein [Pelosinus sp.]